SPGDTLYFEGDTARWAYVLADGRIRYQDGIEGSIHAVARHIAGAPANGWEVWYYDDAKRGVRLPIDALRQRYLQEMGGGEK
ncbi:MAG: site-specific DNA-methyltransferase, partial [Fimbriimonadales bacterium]